MPSTAEFKFDVFLSHSSKDKKAVYVIANRLRADGLRIWFSEWEIRRGDNAGVEYEEGLEHSRVLVLCMSENAFGSEWAQLEASSFRFRDPLNKDRRFIPLRLDDTAIKDSLTQFLYISWLPHEREQAYSKLLEACRPPRKLSAVDVQAVQLGVKGRIWAYAFSPDGKRVLTGGDDHRVRLWDTRTGRCLRVLEGHTDIITSVRWRADQCSAISCSNDKNIRLWDVETGRCLRVFKGHTDRVYSVAWSSDRRALSCSADATLRLWDERGRCLRVLTGHTRPVYCLAWSADHRRAVSGAGANDNSIRLWHVETGLSHRVLTGHTDSVFCVAWGANEQHVLSGSGDGTVRLWEVDTGRCLRVLEGHTDAVDRLAWSANHLHALSGSNDATLRLWEVDTGRCLRVLQGHANSIIEITWSADRRFAFSGDSGGSIRVWDLTEFSPIQHEAKTLPRALAPAPEQVQYTNAKVLLVGESGTGKTGLSKRLALNEWQVSDSTVGAWATHWKLPVSSGDSVQREIWLWDFGGQADQRLIHQLYMDETALVVLVFDGQKEDLFETLGQWDRDFNRTAHSSISKLLVAGRVDTGGLRVSRAQIEAFRKERGYLQLLETSAKTNLGCDELKQAILDGIRWEDIPWRSSPLLFKRLKEEILRLKDAGRVLMRFNELRETLQLHLLEEGKTGGERFTDEELKAVVNLLAGPGVVWELKFGSWVLLQPERINAYAQAVIQTMRADEHERGCLSEERVLHGELIYNSSMQRLKPEEEQFVRLAMHQTLVERGLCLREHTEKGTLLIFPSYYRRERPELVGHPAVLVSYRFSGFLDEIYATLVVRLHHTQPFQQDQLWRYAADFRTLLGRQLGIKLTRRAEGAGELEVYFDPTIPMEEKIIFSKYIHEHLLQNASDVLRLRHYVCPHCGTPVGNREVAMRKLGEGRRDILCVDCERRIPLWDELEELFASPEMNQYVHDLQGQSSIVLDNESKERALVGEVISTVALAGQIGREYNVSDHGIDMEVEFKSDAGEATGRKVYLQLKSGDLQLRKRKLDGAEIFTVKKERHARYWMAQRFPVIIVIRNSKGEIRWMEVREWLKRASGGSKKPVKNIVFEGERFDVMSVRRWRDYALAGLPRGTTFV